MRGKAQASTAHPSLASARGGRLRSANAFQRVLLERERQAGLVYGDLAEPESPPRMRRVPGHRRALRLRQGRGQREDERRRRMVRDLAGPEVMLLVDVPVEDGDVLPMLEQVDGFAAVPGCPVPRRRQIEERSEERRV